MTTNEILDSLTECQRKELEKDLEEMKDKILLEGGITSDKLGNANVNIRLDNNKLLLNVTVLFRMSPEGKLESEIANITKLDTMDEYLDSIIDARNPKDNWKTLK
jgi:hypothetical protein